MGLLASARCRSVRQTPAYLFNNADEKREREREREEQEENASERMKYSEKVIDRDRQTDRQAGSIECCSNSERRASNTRAVVQHTAKSSVMHRRRYTSDS